MTSRSAESQPSDDPQGTLRDEAVDWVVLLASGRATAVDRAAFARWRRQSATHERAAREMEAIWSDIGRADVATHHLASETGSPKGGETHTLRATGPFGRMPKRRSVVGAALAACLALAAVTIERFAINLFADFATAAGEYREVALSDGSTMLLNTATAVSVDYDRSRRHIVLHEGEAQFRAQPDRDRPFVVTSDTGEVTAIGTVFAVRDEGGRFRVTVSEGRVKLVSQTRISDTATLDTGTEGTIGPNGDIRLQSDVDIAAATAWTRGKLVFNNQPLSEVVAELGRHFPGRIVILDERLDDVRVSGVFDLADPDATLHSIERALGFDVVHLPLLTILR